MIEAIEVAVLPSEARLLAADCYLVIDVLRATTTIAMLFAAGVRRLTAVDTLDEARARAARESAVLLGEVGGVAPEGFDAGNSPLEASLLPVRARSAVHFTTNGTRALAGLADLGPVIAAAPANARAVAEYVAKRFRRVVIVAAGNGEGRTFSLEDFAAAGVLVRELLSLAPSAPLGDAAALAASTTPEMMAASQHAALLRDLGLEADVDFATGMNTSIAVPGVIDFGAGWATLCDLARPA